MNRDEIRRLEKAAREKDKKYLYEWAAALELSIYRDLEKQFEGINHEYMQAAIDNLCTAVAYTAHYNEDCMLGPDKLPGFMEDFFATVDMFRTGEFKPDDYREELQNNGIGLDLFAYRQRQHKVITLTGKISKSIYNNLVKKGHIILSDVTKDIELEKEKIRMSDVLLVTQEKEKINDFVKELTDYAREKDKFVRYLYEEEELLNECSKKN